MIRAVVWLNIFAKTASTALSAGRGTPDSSVITFNRTERTGIIKDATKNGTASVTHMIVMNASIAKHLWGIACSGEKTGAARRTVKTTAARSVGFHFQARCTSKRPRAAFCSANISFAVRVGSPVTCIYSRLMALSNHAISASPLTANFVSLSIFSINAGRVFSPDVLSYFFTIFRNPVRFSLLYCCKFWTFSYNFRSRASGDSSLNRRRRLNPGTGEPSAEGTTPSLTSLRVATKSLRHSASLAMKKVSTASSSFPRASSKVSPDPPWSMVTVSRGVLSDPPKFPLEGPKCPLPPSPSTA
eukprot:comp22443_c0_seq1/m.33710 comp22443_c0_seq1/g.33710  ORF comp22443_c0_seq1/g.33710 comp22443_c0_seq1/m.33710 type:complete len:301 (+) comp22443_c0_seq1:1179-2081(+)